MIKRVIGTLFTVAVIAVIAFVALGAGSYESMLPEDAFSFAVRGAAQESAEEQRESAETPVVEQQDSLAGEQAVADEGADAAEVPETAEETAEEPAEQE